MILIEWLNHDAAPFVDIKRWMAGVDVQAAAFAAHNFAGLGDEVFEQVSPDGDAHQ